MVDRKAFIASLAPAAEETGRRIGVDPRIILAQAALESNWGRSAPGNNFFGIKSHGASGGNVLSTTEVVNGQPVRIRDSFRAYASPADSVQGYGDFISRNPRYAAFRSAQGLDAQIAALGKSGYATDPNYAAKIGSIARGLGGDGASVASMFGGAPPMASAAAAPAAPVPSIEQLAPQAMAIMTGGQAPAVAGGPGMAPQADGLTGLASLVIQGQQNRQRQREEEQAAADARRTALLSGSLSGLFGA